MVLDFNKNKDNTMDTVMDIIRDNNKITELAKWCESKHNLDKFEYPAYIDVISKKIIDKPHMGRTGVWANLKTVKLDNAIDDEQLKFHNDTINHVKNRKHDYSVVMEIIQDSLFKAVRKYDKAMIKIKPQSKLQRFKEGKLYLEDMSDSDLLNAFVWADGFDKRWPKRFDIFWHSSEKLRDRLSKMFDRLNMTDEKLLTKLHFHYKNTYATHYYSHLFNSEDFMDLYLKKMVNAIFNIQIQSDQNLYDMFAKDIPGIVAYANLSDSAIELIKDNFESVINGSKFYLYVLDSENKANLDRLGIEPQTLYVSKLDTATSYNILNDTKTLEDFGTVYLKDRFTIADKFMQDGNDQLVETLIDLTKNDNISLLMDDKDYYELSRLGDELRKFFNSYSFDFGNKTPLKKQKLFYFMQKVKHLPMNEIQNVMYL